MNEFSTLLTRSGMTIAAAADLLGVSRWTVRNWRDGRSRIPSQSMDLMRAVVDMSQPDAPQSPTDRRDLLLACQAAQAETIARLERELAEERAALAETELKLAALR